MQTILEKKTIAKRRMKEKWEIRSEGGRRAKNSY